MRIESLAAAQTEAIGERVGQVAEPGAVVGLVGPLGAGKTTFVRGLARGLGADPGEVHSPTFITATVYQGRLPLTHVDLYRHDETLPPSDWLAEILEGEGLAVVEWFERLGAEAPGDVLLVHLGYGETTDRRSLTFEACGPRAKAMLARTIGVEADAASAGARLHS